MQHDIDRERSREHIADGPSLKDYDELMKFVVNLSRSARFQKRSSAKPLTANMVAEGNVPDDETATDTKFTVEEWIA